ncbi:MAG: methylenetetrahydrofolate reductase [NAD(P)H] [Candidatus Omnitrophica bacterium]|nr:methylenetetrahydrofolate reductase [NAD(P)H] [Candidatus Omnitrophota bacterium]MDD5429634.1 methylenetetrahydrofolate reductase [NAD(P)H] [Candidatus Omnitrophota bacterium]
MKIGDILKQNSRGVSFEFFPPKTDKGMDKLISTSLMLQDYSPLYFSMTYGALGKNQDRTKKAVYGLLDKATAAVMPHLTCIASSRSKVADLLSEYKDRGVENLMALRGDLPAEGFEPAGECEDFKYAVDLVKFIKKHTNFCIGVAVYPETHIESSSVEEDCEYTKRKIDAGAEFAVTQMFFDNKYYYEFMNRASRQKINIPVLPGIFPLTDIRKLDNFLKTCRVSLPRRIKEDMEKLSEHPQDMEKAGLEFTIKQCQDLINNGVRKLHFFTFNRPDTIKKILDNLNW